MMYMPTVFGDTLFDDFMDDFFEAMDRMNREMDKRLYGNNAQRIMSTDVKENDDNYEVAIDLPGFKKDEVSVKLDKGYLTVSAAKKFDSDDHKDDKKEEKKDKYIRKERVSGNVSRTFYIGNSMKQEDIHAKFEDGVLTLTIPKKDVKAVDADKYIAIE